MSIMRNPLLTVLALFACLGAPAWAAREPSVAEVKAESLQYLQELRAQNNKRLIEINANLDKDQDLEEDEGKALGTLKAAQREHSLRQEFLDRLILQIDTKFRGGDLRNFIEYALKEINKAEHTSPADDNGMVKFVDYAADTIHRLPDKKENVLSFLEDYMSHSVLNPISPESYLSSRNYTNGSASASGSPVERSEAGALAERRLRQISEATNAAQKRRR